MTTFTSLHAPLPDDNMEMSSPAHPTYDDDDIDIDFDEPIGGVELTDDDRMADDTEQPRPGTATDDMMEDDAPVQTAQAPEQEMQDDFDSAAYEQGDPDDELIDYSDDEIEDVSEVKEQTVFEPTAPEITIQDREHTDPGFEQVDEEIIREPEISAPAQDAAVEASAPEVVTAALETSAPELIAAPIADESFADADEGTDDHNDVENDANAAADDVVATADDQHRETTPVVDPAEEPFPDLPEDSPELKAVAPIPAPIETNLDAGDDAPATPTDTGLHPMFVQYGDWTWPLFKSRNQPEGLLKDDNLASVALADLLNSCRSRLASKAGEDISEDQEFVLRFDSIGLTIVENSPSAFNTSLDEILAVFRQLHINGGAQSIPPFWMLLSLQIKPSSYLTMLKQGAAVGQSIYDFVDVPGDDEDYEYPQDGDEDPTLLGDGSGNEYEYQPQDDRQPHAESEANESGPHEHDTSHENTEGGQEPQDTHDQYGQYDAAQQAEYEAQQAEFEAQQAEDQTQQAVHETQLAEFEPHADNEGQHADVATEHAEEASDAQQSEEAEDASFVVTDDVAVDPGYEVEAPATASAPEVIDNATGEAHDGEDQDQETAEISNGEPAASSTDQAHDAVDDHSKYNDEDLIDWDEPLTRRPSEHNADDTDDYSKFLAENDIESADPETANKENQRTLETDNTNVTTGDQYNHVVDGHDDTVTADIDFEDEDFEDDTEDADQEAPTTEAVDVAANGEVQEQSETQTSANGAAESPSELRDTPAAVQPQAEVLPSKEPVRNDEVHIDFGEDEDTIDFDEESYEEHEARMASVEAKSQTPPGKRPHDDAGDDEQPELKKVKSS